MAQLTEIQKMMLQKVADMKSVPDQGAFNLRLNGKGFVRHSSEHIDIVPKEDKPGIDIYIKEGTQGETVAIPVVITESGMDDLVYNDFHIADGVDVNIVAGCGIHNCGCEDSIMAPETVPAEEFSILRPFSILARAPRCSWT